MDREGVIATLRANREQLQAAGILSLSLFGSFARGQQGRESDVDLLADFDARKVTNILQVVHLQDLLRETLCSEVDLSSMAWLKPAVRARAEREAVSVFFRDTQMGEPSLSGAAVTL